MKMESKSFLCKLKEAGIIDFSYFNFESGEKVNIPEEKTNLIKESSFQINNEFFNDGRLYKMKNGRIKLLLFREDPDVAYYIELINKMYEVLGSDRSNPKRNRFSQKDENKIKNWKYKYPNSKTSILREWKDEETGFFIRIGFNTFEPGLVIKISQYIFI